MFTNRLFNPLIVATLMMITACSPGATPTVTPAATVQVPPILQPNTDTGGWSEDLPPNGVWQATLTPEAFVQMGVSRYVAEEEWAGVYTWTFQDGKAQLDFEGPIKTGTFTCLAEYAAADSVVGFTFTSSGPSGACAGALDHVQWRLNDDGLHFHLVASSRGPFVERQTTYEAKPFRNIAGP
jgi:hypothetical protein